MLAITVDTNLDVVDAHDNVTSLREAIATANSSTEDTINFSPAVFTGGQNSLIRLTGGVLELTDTLTIDGSTGVAVTITGDANDDDVTDELNITNVSASTPGGVFGGPSDLLDDNSRVMLFSSMAGDLTLQAVTVTGGRVVEFNHASATGGGIYFNSDGKLRLIGSTVSGNSIHAFTASGGGIATNSGEVILEDSVVSGNASVTRGGGVYTYSGDVTLSNSSMSSNTSRTGGGIYSRYGSVGLTNSAANSNTARQDGGGIATRNGGVNVVNSTISGNNVTNTTGNSGNGGGISTRSGDIDVTSSEVSGNTVTADFAFGGGMYTRYGRVSLIGSTVSRNRALERPNKTVSSRSLLGRVR